MFHKNADPDSAAHILQGFRDSFERAMQFKSFEPTLPPQEFFNQNWIITFGHAQETTKKLSSCLLIDALHNYLITLPRCTN